MKIGNKLTLGFIGIALLIGVVGFISVNTSQKTLQRTIGENSADLARDILDKIDRDIYHRIEQLQIYVEDVAQEEILIDSNEEFGSIDNVQDDIHQKDKEWTSVPKEKITSFMQELIDNELSQELREEIELKKFYEERYGYQVFAEVFVTNKYGVNVAQTQKTTDYYQADEEWWQLAKKGGLHIRDVAYDESADVYSTDISMRINDGQGSFLGVMKVVLNVEEVINIVREAEPGGIHKEHETRHFKLLTKDGRLIYSTKEFQFFGYLSNGLFSRFKVLGEPGHIPYFIEEGDEPGEEKEMFAYAHSRGYKTYKGLGWILVIEHEVAEIFAPVIKLKNILLIVSLIVTILALLVGLFVSRSISLPIRKLNNMALEIGKGKLDKRIEIKSRDELGFLATSFNKMAEELLKLIGREKELSAKAAAADVDRKRTVELEIAYKKLQEAQDMLIQAEKLNAVGRLASGVAHEVKNPLGIIIQGVNYLEKRLASSEHDVSEVFGMIKSNVKRADDIVRGLVDFSRATKLELKPEDVNSILEDSLLLVQYKFRLENIKVVKEIKEDLPKVSVDKRRMEQVFVNIFLNALQAMPDGGKLSLRTYLTQIDEPRDGAGRRNGDNFKLAEKSVIVEIEDTGRGISKEDLKKVFDPFFTTKGPRQGTGLGLSVTKNIVQMHKGLIELKSEEGKGTKAILTLKISRRV